MKIIKKGKRKIRIPVSNIVFYQLVLSFLLLAQFRSHGQVNLKTIEDISPRFRINDTHFEDIATINDIGTFIFFVMECYSEHCDEEIAKCVVNNDLKECYFQDGVEASGDVVFYVNPDGKVDKNTIGFVGKFNDYSKDFLKDVLLKSSPYWQSRRLNESIVRSKRMYLPVMITSKKGRFPDESIGFYHKLFDSITSETPYNIYDFGSFCLLKPVKYYVQY
jgi:hypothetical protein